MFFECPKFQIPKIILNILLSKAHINLSLLILVIDGENNIRIYDNLF